MATVSFHLKAPGAACPTAIFALLTIDRRTRIKVYTGQSILPNRWNKAEQKAQVRGKGNELHGHLNDALDEISKKLLLAYTQHLATGTLPTATTLREAAIPSQSAEAEHTALKPKGGQFWECYAEWVDYTRTAGTVATAQANATAGRHLREFAERAGYALDFDTLTPTVGDRWTAYLLNVVGLTDNTINKALARLKSFMKWATQRGYTENTALSRVTWAQREPDVLTLTVAELAALENLPLAPGSRLEKARAWFLLACYTGLRYSDLVSIRPQHLRPATAAMPAHLRLTAKKTRAVVNVPLTAAALALVGRLLAGELGSIKGQPITNPVLNRFLKELGELAGIDSAVEVIRYRGGVADVSTCPKYEKLTVHTARRTFVTLALGKGMSAEFVMKLSGHTSYGAFKRYVNLTPERIGEEFAKFHEMPN